MLSPPTTAPPDWVALEVSRRTTFGGVSVPRVVPMVRCPRRGTSECLPQGGVGPPLGKSIQIGECADCPYRKGDVTAEAREVLCGAPPHEDEGTLWALLHSPGYLESWLSDDPLVSFVMSSTVFCVTPGTLLSTLERILLCHQISGVPVVDEDGRPIGVVSMSDLLAERDENGSIVEHSPDKSHTQYGKTFNLEFGFGVTMRSDTPVSAIMQLPAFSIGENERLSVAAQTMARYRIHRLPVVSTDGVVVGLLSSLDVTQWFGHRQQLYRRGVLEEETDQLPLELALVNRA